MAKVLISESYLTEIADAIRAKANTTNNYTPAQMGPAITNISTVNNQNKTVNSSTSQQTVTADSGYTGLGTVTINAIATTTHPNPSASINSSTGLVTASHTQTAGYVSAGTTTGTLQLSTQAAKTVTPSTSAQTAVAAGKYTLGAITVAAIPSQYIVPSGSLTITANDTYDVTSYASVEVEIPSGVNNQSKTVTPTKATQTVTPDSGYSGLSQVKVNAIPAAYITTTDADAVAANLLYNKTAYVNGSKITGTMANNGATGTTITTQGGTYTIPAGYTSGGTVTASITASTVTNTIINGTAFEEETGDYGFRATVNIPAGYHNATTLTKDFSTILPAPDTEGTASQVLIGYDLYNHEGQVISGTMANNGTWNRTLSDSTTSVTIPAGYHNGSGKVNISTVAIPNPTISVSAAGVITASGSWTKGYTTNNSYSNTKTLTTQAAKTVSPTESEQTAVAANTYTTGIVKVGAISSTYVGSGITLRSSTDLTVSGATVTAPAGYYADSASKSVSTMTLPTSASSSATSGYTGKATIGRSTSAQYINIPPGYNSAGAYYVISAVANGSASAPSTISGTSATVSTGTNTLTLTKTVSITPSVTAGYISSGTATNSSVSLTASVTTKAAATYHPSATAQSIAASTYLTGIQTINAVTTTNLTAANIKKDVVVKIGDSSDDACVVSITGTYEGSGGGLTVATSTATLSSTQGFIQFNDLLGQPTSFVVIAQNGITTGSPSRCVACVFDGTNLFGQNITNTSNAQVSYSSGSLNMSFSGGTLTISSSGADFQAIEYKLVYTYGGSDISTADVQVGSGATSITFTGLEEEPSYFSCVFKSNFSTSSGYQRVIAVVYDGTDTYGMEMDSSAKYSDAHWSYSYSNGSLTITSSGTNAGGYFHQPGYYQLTYAVEGSSGNYQSKTVYATSSQQVITADSTYDALKQVTIPAVTTTNLSASNIVSGVTIQVGDAADSDRIASVTGTLTFKTVYTGSSTPSSSLGENGDIYIQA